MYPSLRTIDPEPQLEKRIARQKPLKGGLNQLNSSQDKVQPQVFVKKSPPSNFAQAVATSTGFELREEEEVGLNLVVATASVDHVISRSEAAINIEGYGRFTLHQDHLDLGSEENFYRLHDLKLFFQEEFGNHSQKDSNF